MEKLSVKINTVFIEGIQKLFTHHNIISLSGESGTGKTTLTLQLVGTLLTYSHPYQDTCIWIQASELFSLKRLHQIFQEFNKKLKYIQNNIYLIPQKSIINTYEQQSTIIQHIIDSKTILPPSLRFIVIDNISYHLRYELTQYNTPKDVSLLLDAFYETQLMPLIFFCIKHDVILILIHEVSYSPKEQGNRPFFHKLYDRIRTIDIVLSNMFNNEKKNLQILYENVLWKFQYILEDRGIFVE